MNPIFSNFERFVRIYKDDTNLVNAAKAIKYLKDTGVYIGIPQKTTTRKGDEITNAELLFIHTNGSPVNHIPPRPVIEPVIERNQDKVNESLKKIMFLVYNHKMNQADIELEKLGMRFQNLSRAWFTNEENGWPPNSPVTLARKYPKDRPLIDTGELRKSITYVVKRGR